MSNIRIDLRAELKRQIDTILDTFFLNAHSDSIPPYCVLDIKEIDNDVGTDYELEIELIDENDDTSNIEIKCSEIKDLLDRKRNFLANSAYIIYFDSCITKINEEKFIKTRLISFKIRLFEFKKEERK